MNAYDRFPFMRNVVTPLYLTGLLAIFALCACETADSANHPAAPAPAPHSIALVELFTSEGCSSCPPADALLAQLAQDKTLDGHVLTIAYHVDYWDNLGWKDRFDSPAFTDRQSNYSRAFGLDQVYTPQMIVNGQTQFVGSDRAMADKAIAAALREPPPADLDLSASFKQPGMIHVRWKATGVDAGETLQLVLIENDLHTAIQAGENAGRTLDHQSVARAIAAQPLAKDTTQGEADLTVPPDAKPANLQVVGFVQNDNTMAVVGAARVAHIEPAATP